MISRFSIKTLRKKAGLTQEQLALEADLNVRTVHNIENGINSNPTINTLNKIEAVLL